LGCANNPGVEPGEQQALAALRCVGGAFTCFHSVPVSGHLYGQLACLTPSREEGYA
jgi:hypothetical protein